MAIRDWFVHNKKKTKKHDDFLCFDGNPQTFRLLTRLQVLNDDFGLNLTVATLSALAKYPCFHDSKDREKFRKFGIFETERDIAEEVWRTTGLREGMRHPLAYITEACDDIAYSVIDAEDTVKKGYASFYDLMDFLDSNAPKDNVTKDIIKASRRKNRDFKTTTLSSRELNDISMLMFRVKAISTMVVSATNVFVKNIDRIMNGFVPKGFSLINKSNCQNLCRNLKEFDKRNGYLHREVLELELEGSNYIMGTMDLLWKAISESPEKRGAYEKYAYGSISENYRRVYEASPMKRYDRQRLLCDAISGMTEQHLIRIHDELRNLYDGPT